MTSLIDRRNGIAEGLAAKAPCRVATTANITLAGLQTIDGVAVVAGDRVLVKNQTDTTQNGIYDASTGDWTRSLDFDGNRDVVQGTRVAVNLGSTNLVSEWYVTAADPITIDTSAITFDTRELDNAATAADRVQTGLDRVSTAAAAISTAADAAAAHADRLLADADAAAASTPSQTYVLLAGTSLTINAANAATYRGTIIRCTSASAVTITLANDMTVGFNCGVRQVGAGQVTFTAAMGATLNNVDSETKTAGQLATVLLDVDTNSGGSAAVWNLTGRTGT